MWETELERNTATLFNPRLLPGRGHLVTDAGSANTNNVSESLIIVVSGNGEEQCIPAKLLCGASGHAPTGLCVSVQSPPCCMDGETDLCRGPGAEAREHSFLVLTFLFIWKIFLHFFVPFLFLFISINCTATLSSTALGDRAGFSCRPLQSLSLERYIAEPV